MAKYFLGVEILGTSVKIAVIEAGKKLTLTSVEKLELPLGDAAQDFLNDWVGAKFKSQDDLKAVLAISESSIFLEKIKLPSTSKKEELEEALYWELSSTTSVPVSELSYDWKMISDKSGKPFARVAMAKTTFVENWVNLFENSGIKVMLVEPSSTSFTRAAKLDFSKLTLSLVVEEKGTDLVVLENRVPIFSTSISISLGAVEGDHRKLKKDVSEEIAESAKKIVSYWEEKEDKKIEQAVITGAIANKYFGLATEINKFLDFPVVVAKRKSLSNLEYKDLKENDVEQNMVSVGAALFFVHEHAATSEKSLNLLPKDKKRVLEDAVKLTELSQNLASITKINFVALTATAVIVLSLVLVRSSIQSLTMSTKQEVANHPAQEITEKVVEDNKTLVRANKYLATFQNPSQRLSEIVNLVPTNLVFEVISLDNTKEEKWVIEGVGSKEEIIAFYQKLVSESSAKSVSMPYSNFGNSDDNKFEIELKW